MLALLVVVDMMLCMEQFPKTVFSHKRFSEMFSPKSGFPKNGLPTTVSKNSFPKTVFLQETVFHKQLSNKRFAKKRFSKHVLYKKRFFSQQTVFSQLNTESSIRQTHHCVIACIMFQATNTCSQLLQYVNLHMTTACGCNCHLPERRIKLEPPPDFAYLRCICVHCGPEEPDGIRRCPQYIFALAWSLKQGFCGDCEHHRPRIMRRDLAWQCWGCRKVWPLHWRTCAWCYHDWQCWGCERIYHHYERTCPFCHPYRYIISV